MQTSVDISLFAPGSAVGRIHGTMDFAVLPRVGELVSLPEAFVPDAGFTGQLAVMHVIHSPIQSTQEPMLLLADIVAPTESAAISIGQAFERCYGLFFDPYKE